MKRFVEFYSHELNKKVRIPIDIKLEVDNGRQMLHVEVPQQIFGVTKEFVSTAAVWDA
jgi:hypothetical protein